MKTIKIVNIIFLFAIVLAATVHTLAQGSPNSRLCNCFAEPIPDKFMHGVKAVYGTIGIYLSPNLELSPQQLQPVKFTLPTIKSGCILAIQSITVLNQLVEAPPSRLAPKSSLTGISLGFSTPASVPAPTDTKISAIVRYSLNGRKCTETIQLPFRRCN